MRTIEDVSEYIIVLENHLDKKMLNIFFCIHFPTDTFPTTCLNLQQVHISPYFLKTGEIVEFFIFQEIPKGLHAWRMDDCVTADLDLAEFTYIILNFK